MDYEYENLIQLGCHYCGKDVTKDGGTCLDRIESNRGYILDNVVASCRRCNVAKNDMTFSEFMFWIERTYKHTQKMMEFVKTLEPKVNHYNIEKRIHRTLSSNNSKKCIKNY